MRWLAAAPPACGRAKVEVRPLPFEVIAMKRTPMKRISVIGLMAACLSVPAAFAASAQDAPPVEVDAEAEARAQLESDREATGMQSTDADVQAEADVDRNCLRYTGSHISTRALDQKDKDCVSANGRVYSREDIRNTGQTDLADALRMLDPAVF